LPKSEAFDELYAVTRERLTDQLTALAGDRSEAQDLVQEAFVRAWIRWDTVSAYDDPEGWIRRVAYNLGVSRWRKARRLLLLPSPAGVLPSAAGLVSDGSSIGGPGESIGVIAALQTLPVPERRAVVLHHVAGLSVEEVAAEVGSPVGTVKSWLARGRSRLQAELDSQGVHNHG
jgi:RNA polymerase sigma-70 factor, ECF subfamily